MIHIVDYNLGNLFSVKKAFDRINVKAEITSDHKILLHAKKIVLPGVGHFSKAVELLKNKGIWDIILELVLVKKIPILGICLGMQLFAKYSEEGDLSGFGFLNTDVKKFVINNKFKYKLPHIGWNTVLLKKEDILFKDINKYSEFYFVHNFHIMSTEENSIIGTTIYENEFVSAVHKDNIFGVQFHPEKSHRSGEIILKNFATV